MQSYHFKKSLAMSFFFARRWAEVGGNAPPTFADSVLYPLAVKVKASAVFFLEKRLKKPVGLDGL